MPDSGGIGDGARGEQDRRRRAVVGADPQQPAHDVRHVGTETAPVVMALVDDDETQPGQEPRPGDVVRQHRQVEHVGVGEHNLGVAACPVAGRAGAVTVVGRDADPRVVLVECPLLIGRQRLGRRHIESGAAALTAGPTAGEGAGDGRQVIGERLARPRPGGEDNVTSIPQQPRGRCLMGPQLGDPLSAQRCPKGRRDPNRPGRGPPGVCRKDRHMGQSLFESGLLAQTVEEVLGSAGRGGRHGHARSVSNRTDGDEPATVRAGSAWWLARRGLIQEESGLGLTAAGGDA